MRFPVFIGAVVLESLLLILTGKDERPADGYFYLGYPKRFVEIYVDRSLRKEVMNWFPSGIVLNVLFFILIYLLLELLRRKIVVKKE